MIIMNEWMMFLLWGPTYNSFYFSLLRANPKTRPLRTRGVPYLPYQCGVGQVFWSFFSNCPLVHLILTYIYKGFFMGKKNLPPNSPDFKGKKNLNPNHAIFMISYGRYLSQEYKKDSGFVSTFISSTQPNHLAKSSYYGSIMVTTLSRATSQNWTKNNF
jgi:hypothetical protein